jgi:predicted NAD/FAD-binding protein
LFVSRIQNDAALKLAVVGAGVSGIVSAHILQRRYDVTLYEKNDYVGGHTKTVVIEDGDDKGLNVDTGFIVFNDRTYPLFVKFLAQLGVQAQDSDMSFSYWCERTGLQYGGTNLNTLFGQRSNIVRLRFWRMLRDITRFNREACRALETGTLDGLTLGEYLARGAYGASMIRDYIIPMGAAIWSTPPARMLEFPALTFVRFFKNHGLLSISDRPQWKTIAGGSSCYVHAFLKSFRGNVVTGARIVGIRREPDRAVLRFAGGTEEPFHRVVLAAHANESLALLEDPSDAEQRVLGVWPYQHNRVVLHTDSAVMPPTRRIWSSWNYTREASLGSDGNVSLTYHMNRLQRFRAKHEYFVSLNRNNPLPARAAIRELTFSHPVFTRESVGTRAELAGLNGTRNTWFCGAYCGNGFHEDGVRSAVAVARDMGLEL